MFQGDSGGGVYKPAEPDVLLGIISFSGSPQCHKVSAAENVASLRVWICEEAGVGCLRQDNQNENSVIYGYGKSEKTCAHSS